jgi:hypothetical protein
MLPLQALQLIVFKLVQSITLSDWVQYPLFIQALNLFLKPFPNF